MGEPSVGGELLWREAKNAANAGIGKLRRKHPRIAEAYQENDGLFSVAVAKWRWTCAPQGDVLSP
jgi:hypothetical protein